MRFLSAAEVERLADAVDTRYRGVVFVGAYGGLRAGEIFALTAKRIDLNARTVRVETNLSEWNTRSETGPKTQLEIGRPKTKAGRRTVPLPASVVDELAPLLVGSHLDDVLFPAPKGNYVRRAGWRNRFWLPAIQRANIEPGFRVHDLRHTAAAAWIAHGVDALQIARWMGHTSVSVVLDRYGHLFPGHEAGVMARLDEARRNGDARPSDTT